MYVLLPTPKSAYSFWNFIEKMEMKCRKAAIFEHITRRDCATHSYRTSL